MYKALKRREKEREEAIQIASDYAQRLEKAIGSLTGVLYGSFARGDFNLGSDIDVLIISNSLPEGFFKRIELLYHYVQGMIEPKGYTQTEFLNMLHSNNPLAIDALKNGEILLDNGFWQKLMRGRERIKRE
jgi:predicted nucleotidyltransferase